MNPSLCKAIEKDFQCRRRVRKNPVHKIETITTVLSFPSLANFEVHYTYFKKFHL
jgi:hypothetical protein